jgi:hypothetical protein
MDSQQLISLLLTILGFLIAAIGGWFVFEFRELRRSVDKLNTSVSHVIDRIEAHEERLDKIDGFLNAQNRASAHVF